MIPLRDNIPARFPPITMWVLIGVNAIVFYLQTTVSPDQLPSVIGRLGLIPATLTDGVVPLETVPLLTSMFLHGSFGHLLGNMWTLWLFGDNVEDRMGSVRFALFYLICGLAAGVTHVVLHPQSDIPTIGASGAVAGVMGAYLVMYPRASLIMFFPIVIYPVFFRMSAVVYLLGWFIMQFVMGHQSLSSRGEPVGVAFWAHVGGFVAGLVLHRLFVSERRTHRFPEQRVVVEQAW